MSALQNDGDDRSGRTARSGRVRTTVLVAAGVLLGAVSGAALVRAPRTRAVAAKDVPTPALQIEVPRAAGEITIDGELEDPGWTGAIGRTGAFMTDGRPTRPYSDARFVHRNGQLYIVLYAADEDLRTTRARHDEPLYGGDTFQLTFRTSSGEFLVDVSSTGVVTDARRRSTGAPDFSWESHARVAIDRDGTIDDPSDQDEEWVVEMAIPLDALGVTERAGERIGLEVRRCDEVPSVGRVCGGWGSPGHGATLVLTDHDIQ